MGIEVNSPKYTRRDVHRSQEWEQLKAQKRAEMQEGDHVIYKHWVLGKFSIPKLVTQNGILGAGGIFSAKTHSEVHANDVYVYGVNGAMAATAWWPAKHVHKPNR